MRAALGHQRLVLQFFCTLGDCSGKLRHVNRGCQADTRAASRSNRRVANRESARRVRQKRQETMDEMKGRLDVLTQQLHALTVQTLLATPPVLHAAALCRPSA